MSMAPRMIGTLRAAAHPPWGALLALLPLLSSCAPEAEPREALEEHFGEKARIILGGEARFQVGQDGYFVNAVRDASGLVRRPGARLPKRADGAIQISLPSGRTVTVREQGAFGQATVTEQAVVYRRDGGASFWTVTAAGIEEWLHIDALPPSGEAGTWEVSGLRVQQHGASVDLYDESGVARMTVSAPEAYGGDGRPLVVRLVARGSVITAEVEAAVGTRVLVDPVWVAAGSMAEAREWHTATRLQDGRVLVAGGEWNDWNLRVYDAELYDPMTFTWSSAGTLAHPRVAHASVLLPNGRVMVVGGVDAETGKAVEIYDPATNVWTETVPANGERGAARIVTLVDGRILVVGGIFDSYGAEIYDHVAGTWTFTAPMLAPRDYHTASMLPDSTVLITGGVESASTEIYDAQANLWKPGSPMIISRSSHSATVLSDGRIVVAGGYIDSATKTSSAEEYSPSTKNWSLVGDMKNARAGHRETMVDGRAMVVGGIGDDEDVLAGVEDYDAALWSPTSSLIWKRALFAMVPLLNGSVLVCGGRGGGGTTEIYYPKPLPLGAACGDKSTACESGFCIQGICCNEMCNTDTCSTCVAAEGAPSDGTCIKFSGRSCEADGDLCTEHDHCENGVCIKSERKTCPEPPPCYLAPGCYSATGKCDEPHQTADDGVDCPGGTCYAGVCQPRKASTTGGSSSSGEAGCSGALTGSDESNSRTRTATAFVLAWIACRRRRRPSADRAKSSQGEA